MKKKTTGATELSLKRQRFCEEYVKDFNATAATERAGYAVLPQHRAKFGWRLRQEPEVKEHIKKLMTEMREQADIFAERAMTELSRCAFSNIKDYLDAEGMPVNLSSVDHEKASAVASMKVTETEKIGADGKPVIKRIVEIKMHSKIAALAKLVEVLAWLHKAGAKSAGSEDKPVARIEFADGQYIEI